MVDHYYILSAFTITPQKDLTRCLCGLRSSSIVVWDKLNMKPGRKLAPLEASALAMLASMLMKTMTALVSYQYVYTMAARLTMGISF